MVFVLFGLVSVPAFTAFMRGAFTCVMTVSTPGCASAVAVSMAVIVPRAMVLWTSAA